MTEKQIIRSAMKSLRSRVKPENCRRSLSALRRAQKASVKARLAKARK